MMKLYIYIWYKYWLKVMANYLNVIKLVYVKNNSVC